MRFGVVAAVDNKNRMRMRMAALEECILMDQLRVCASSSVAVELAAAASAAAVTAIAEMQMKLS